MKVLALEDYRRRWQFIRPCCFFILGLKQMKSNLQPIPQPILPSNVGKGGLDDLNLVATGQQVLAVHPFFSTAKI